jgi:hypothetical protein
MFERWNRMLDHVSDKKVLSYSTVTMARNPREKAKLRSRSPEHIQLSEDEQWRLVSESGILQQASHQASDDSSDTPLAEEIFNSLLLIIPFSFVLLMMEMCVNLFLTATLLLSNTAPV